MHQQRGQAGWIAVYGSNDREFRSHDGYVVVFMSKALYVSFPARWCVFVAFLQKH